MACPKSDPPDLNAIPVAKPGLHALVQKYLPDLIFGANDGIITTLAIVSGVVGASLSSQAILILGFANLIADGFSMGASNVLSRRSDSTNGQLPTLAAVARHGMATFFGFAVAGLMPLLAYLVPLSWFQRDPFIFAIALGLLTLFLVGAGRAYFLPRHWFRAGMEMFLIGTVAAAVAYGVGMLGAVLVADTRS